MSKICADIYTQGAIWRARDRSLHQFSEAQRLIESSTGLIYETLVSPKLKFDLKAFQQYIKRCQSTLTKMPTWNFRLQQRNDCVRLHRYGHRWCQMQPEWRMSWSMISNGLGTQIGSIAVRAKQPPLKQWMRYLNTLDQAKPQPIELQQEATIAFSGAMLAFFLEDSLSHAAHKLTQHGSWIHSYPFNPPADPPPTWWQALLPQNMRFLPAEPKPLPSTQWQAVAYDRELYRLILQSRIHHMPTFSLVELGQPLHRFIKALTFAPASVQDQGVYLKNVQWLLPDAHLTLEGNNP